MDAPQAARFNPSRTQIALSAATSASISASEWKGEGVILSRSKRDAVWPVFEEYRGQLASRKLKEGAVRIDGEVVSDPLRTIPCGFEGVLQVGKRTFARVRLISG